MPKQPRPTVHIRLSPDLVRLLKVTAAEGGHSMNAEIVTRLERSFSTDDADRRKALKLLVEAISILDKGQR
ncbi:Arc family DNA-binding protein [Mesorhizobium sp. LNHC221B00]|uniref:Arc family DNA-binding protein n=1 Tax=Mesorhizobium sp. LNHC221B00 TaxID=1287233 RepID=UPI0018DC957E|nr:Arc family DNA-binding protein [Mesorhizobium sp. LNHC221B00]